MFGPVGLKKYSDYARDIHNSGRHLLDLINDILDLSKLEAGKMALHEADVALRTVIDDCVTLVRDQAERGSIVLVTEVEPSLPRLRCDERALKQVLLNFLSNAIKFTPRGGEVRMTVRRASGGIAIAVSDSGIGMNEDEVAVALAAFGQIDSKLARKHQGTGLGLPIAKSLIELHEGTLMVKSAPRAGTTLTALFPASRVVAAAA
jgi:signal transduction histidine kinase